MIQSASAPTLSVIVPAADAPPNLACSLDAIRRAADPPEELLVIETPPGATSAAARNEGAGRASGDLLVFVDADVELHPDAFSRIRSAFAGDEELVALFGSYDDRPPGPGTVAVFRNLLHHHMHHSSPGPATTFWTGIGAIRRDRFDAAGGFDGTAPSVADIELGLRLTTAGARIELDPRVQGTHHKDWTLVGMLRTDLLMRGVPWVELVLRHRSGHTALNLGWRNRLSALAAVGVLLAGVGRRPRLAVASLAPLIGLNRSFYALLARRLGWRAAAGLALHIIHLLTAVVALPVGVSKHLRRRTWTCPYT